RIGSNCLRSCDGAYGPLTDPGRRLRKRHPRHIWQQRKTCKIGFGRTRPMPTPAEIDADGTHDWFNPGWFSSWECCRQCGIIRRADRKNKPCRGAVHVETRIKELEANAHTRRD